MAGKTGVDAIFLGLHHICNTISRYRLKADALVDAAATASIITAPQAVDAHAFIAGATALCDVFRLLANYNSL